MTEQESMLTHLLGCRRIDLYVDAPVLNRNQRGILEMMRMRRSSGEPLQYILGEAEFYGLPFFVDSRVLIPRPETEVLAECAINEARLFNEEGQVKILDIGTGCGNLAISLAGALPGADLTALDICPEALKVAKENAARHGLESRVRFIQGDLWRAFEESGFEESFDLVVSNPPYIPRSQWADLPEEVKKEPRVALDGGGDGMDIFRRIIAGLDKFLARRGRLILEVGDAQARPVKEMLRQKNGSWAVKILNDLTGRQRVIMAGCANGHIDY